LFVNPRQTTDRRPSRQDSNAWNGLTEQSFQEGLGGQSAVSATVDLVPAPG
jgi:hypothetical protein